MLTPYQKTLIAAREVMAIRTIERVYEGGGSSNSRERVRRCAAELGLPPPPSATDLAEQVAK